jgi:hypothetical protein
MTISYKDLNQPVVTECAPTTQPSVNLLSTTQITDRINPLIKGPLARSVVDSASSSTDTQSQQVPLHIPPIALVKYDRSPT